VPEISQAWLALIGALLGGSGLKFIEHYLNRPKVKDDAAQAFRNELREEVKNLREELRKTETELDNWRQKYYALLDEFSKAKIDRDNALQKIQDDADDTARATQDKPAPTRNKERKSLQDARDDAKDDLGE
jgi:regulator of replication initiation timing